MFSSNSIIAATAALSLISSSAATYDANSKANVALYWGSGANQLDLRTYCDEASVDIIPIGFINKFQDQGNGLIGENYGNKCYAGYYPGPGSDPSADSLPIQCPDVQEDIPYCQAQGKKILLSLGGASDTYALTGVDEGIALADFLWGAYGPLTAEWTAAGGLRPLDRGYYNTDTSAYYEIDIDGFDLDIELPSADAQAGYIALIDRLRENFQQNPAKQYIISGAPQCPLLAQNEFEDANMGNMILAAQFDVLWIQFYNNDAAGCTARDWANANPNYPTTQSSITTLNYQAWKNTINSGASNGAKIYIGLKGGPVTDCASPAGYGDWINATEADHLINAFEADDQFGGVMIYDATSASNDCNCGTPYYDIIKNSLTGTSPPKVCTTATSSTVSTTSSSSSSSSTSAPASTTSSSSSSITSSSSAVPTPTTVPSVGTCQYIGCYSEATNSRALDSDTLIDYTDMSVEKCANYCQDYTMFGVEYGGECYCGNTLQAGSVLEAAGDCNQVCDGTPTELCGAGNRLDVYSCGSSSTTSSSASSTQSTSSSSSTSSVDSTTSSSVSSTQSTSSSSTTSSVEPTSTSSSVSTSSSSSSVVPSTSSASSSVEPTTSSSSSSVETSSSTSSVQASSSSSSVAPTTSSSSSSSSTEVSTTSSSSSVSQTTISSSSSIAPSDSTSSTVVPTTSSETSSSVSTSSSSSLITSSSSSTYLTLPPYTNSSSTAKPTSSSASSSSSVSLTGSVTPTESSTTSGLPSSTVSPSGTSESSSIPTSTTAPSGSSKSSDVPTSTGASSGTTQVPYTTSTVYATSVYTVTSCAPTVTNCPARLGSVTTEIIALYTTVCPVTETQGNGGSSTSPTGKPAPPQSSTPTEVTKYTTSTVYTTNVYTVTSCAPEVTDCPARIGSVTTETIQLYTTVCPVANQTPGSPAPSGPAASAPAPKPSGPAASGSAASGPASSSAGNVPAPKPSSPAASGAASPPAGGASSPPAGKSTLTTYITVAFATPSPAGPSTSTILKTVTVAPPQSSSSASSAASNSGAVSIIYSTASVVPIPVTPSAPYPTGGSTKTLQGTGTGLPSVSLVYETVKPVKPSASVVKGEQSSVVAPTVSATPVPSQFTGAAGRVGGGVGVVFSVMVGAVALML